MHLRAVLVLQNQQLARGIVRTGRLPNTPAGLPCNGTLSRHEDNKQAVDGFRRATLPRRISNILYRDISLF